MQEPESRMVRWTMGPLERQLLRILWRRGSATVRELVASGEVPGAYTTVMTTLDRLHKKGILDRLPDGRAFRYSPRRTEREFNTAIARNVVRQLLGSLGRSEAPVSFLVDAVGEYDQQLLDEMERAIERKKKELKAQQRKEQR